MTSIADAIRAKGGTSDTLAFPSGFVEAIEAIQTGGETQKTCCLVFLMQRGLLLPQKI